MPQSTPWYVGQRAESYAVVLFSRLPGVQLQRADGEDRGIDFLVKVNVDAPTRIFGVEVKGAEEMHLVVRGDGTLRSTFSDNLRRHTRDCTFPFAVLVVDVVRENARFGWVLEPKTTATGRGTLGRPSVVRTEVVTMEMLQQRVDQVNVWYDIRSSSDRPSS